LPESMYARLAFPLVRVPPIVPLPVTVSKFVLTVPLIVSFCAVILVTVAWSKFRDIDTLMLSAVIVLVVMVGTVSVCAISAVVHMTSPVNNDPLFRPLVMVAEPANRLFVMVAEPATNTPV
jgi:hypothetical protein